MASTPEAVRASWSEGCDEERAQHRRHGGGRCQRKEGAMGGGDVTGGQAKKGERSRLEQIIDQSIDRARKKKDRCEREEARERGMSEKVHL